MYAQERCVFLFIVCLSLMPTAVCFSFFLTYFYPSPYENNDRFMYFGVSVHAQFLLSLNNIYNNIPGYLYILF